ncbi:MAG: S10 family peptidase [Phycisphaerales bacterium JB039]
MPTKPSSEKTSDKNAGDSSASGPAKAYRTPSGIQREIAWGAGAGGRRGRVKVHADWLLVREHGVPTAEVFFTSYQLGGRGKRPVTFLFNGGPGAASAFLHLGTAGPRRVAFSATGQVLPPPAKLVDNAESWLAFSDLVFVDPVGTGLSRTVAESKLEQQGVDAEEDKTAKRTKGLPDAKQPFYKVKRDIDVLAEFVSQWLSRFNRWDSPVSIAGESYGGFRVGKLVRALPERGVGLTGAIMVSPAIDFLGLGGTDYDLWPWINTIPPMALAAAHHKRSRGRFQGMKTAELRTAAEDFAEQTFASMLLRGERAPKAERDKVLKQLADLLGLPAELIARHGGRVPINIFARELLRDQGLICGLYDAAITGPNVFPDREGMMPNPDPTLAGIMPAFSAAINTLLRAELGLTTEREYLLLGWEVGELWKDDTMPGYWQRQLDCADDTRYGLATSPSMKLLICHGWYDLVTAYFSSERSVAQLRLPEQLRKQVVLKNYDGGHMFYSWDRSRKSLMRDAKAVVG